MSKKQRPKVLLANLNKASGVPRQHLLHLLDTISDELEEKKPEPGMVISVGEYGHIRIDMGNDEQSREVLLIRDVESGTLDANAFVSRFMALKGFEYMDNEAWPEALECFDFALDLHPNNPVLLQARASVKDELIQAAKNNGESFQLAMEVFEDLLRSIDLAPNRADAYRDLLSALKSFRPIEGDSEEHHQWLSKVVERALSHSTHDPDAIRAREALREFEGMNQSRT